MFRSQSMILVGVAIAASLTQIDEVAAQCSGGSGGAGFASGGFQASPGFAQALAGSQPLLLARAQPNPLQVQQALVQR